MPQRIGNNTVRLSGNTGILEFASVAGKKESEGPLKDKFDKLFYDTLMGQETWEQAESQLQLNATELVLEKSGLSASDIQVAFAGDLLNQCISSNYGLADFNIPFCGLYGACSTMALSSILASLLTDCDIAQNSLAVTSSHFCSAERQFRFPIEYGGQRTPTSQWTVTGAGAVIYSKQNPKVLVKEVTIGKITDMGITDINNMGAAMAPAAADTISKYLEDTGTVPSDFDYIVTGDLGKVGSELLIELLKKQDINIKDNHTDCGLLIYDIEKQDVHAGGSGCGCSASVLCAEFLPRLASGEISDILFIATGALMSPTANQQGMSIPSIAHLLHFSSLSSTLNK